MNKYKWLWVPLLVIVTAWFLLLLGYAPLIIQDEGRYVGIAREMLNQHDWLVPWYNGVPFFDKPILYYWLEMVSLKFFGVSEFTARLPQALLGVAGVLMTYHTCRRLFNLQTALLSAVTLSVAPLYFLLAHYADMDLEVAVFIGLSLMSLLIAQQPDSTRAQCRYYMWAAYAAAGCAILTKGFMGIVLPMIVGGLWLFYTRQWQIFKRLHIGVGLIILLAINLPWDIAMKLRFADYWHYFFYQLQFARYFAHNFTHIEPFWFYLPVLLIGTLPVSLLCLSRLFNWRGITWRAPKQPNRAFFIIWFVAIYVFFSVAHTKLIGYMIPVMPAISVLAGMRLASWWRGESKFGVADGVITVLGFIVFAAAFALVPYFFTDLAAAGGQYHAYAIALVMALAAIVSLGAWLKQKSRVVIVTALLATAVMNILVIVCPALQRTNLYLYKDAERYITPTTPVVMYYTYLYDAPFYLNRRSILVNDWHMDLPVFEDSWHWRMQYGAKQTPESAKRWMVSEQVFNRMWSSKQSMVVFVDKAMYSRFVKNRSPKPVIISDHYDFVAVIKQGMKPAQP